MLPVSPLCRKGGKGGFAGDQGHNHRPDRLDRSLLEGTQNYDYRWNLHIYKDSDTGKPYWVINAGQGNPVHVRHFDIRNKDVPVPIGKWIKVEYFWKHHVTDGRFWLKVNDTLVGDHKGRLSHPNGHNRTAAFHSFVKLYVGRGWFHDGNTARVWLDDVEIHTAPPYSPAGDP